MNYPSRFIEVIRFPTENCLYRALCRRRRRIVTIKYSSLPPRLSPRRRLEKRCIEFCLDRCDMLSWRAGHWYHAYLALKGSIR